MIKLKASCDTEEEKNKLIKAMRYAFRFKKEPKVYMKKENPRKRVSIDLLNK